MARSKTTRAQIKTALRKLDVAKRRKQIAQTKFFQADSAVTALEVEIRRLTYQALRDLLGDAAVKKIVIHPR